MFQFGSGLLFVNPNNGNLAANPTPFQPLTIQDVSLDISQELKELKGQNKIADDVAPGDMKITGKFSFGNINIDLYNNVFFADVRQSGVKAIQPREQHSVPASSAYTVVVTNSSTFLTDLGVTYAASNLAMLRVSSAPTQGQYSVSNGTYTFAAADEGQAVLISYVWNSASTGRTVQINNQLMGYGPVFELWLNEPYQSIGGIANGLHLYACRLSKLSSGTKRADYTMPEMDYQAFANSAGNVGEMFQVAN